MPLELRVDGEVVTTIDEQVTRVALQTARGEVSALGVGPADGVIDIVVDRVAEGGPRRLDQIEAAELEELRERAPEGTKVGFSAAEQVNPVAAGQGFHDETLRPGGVDKERSSRSVPRPPVRDLAAGLDPSDTDALTARIRDFDSDGDVDKAIKNNPPSGNPTTAEQGATPQEETTPEPTESEPTEPDQGENLGTGAGLSLSGSTSKTSRTTRKATDSPQA